MEGSTMGQIRRVSEREENAYWTRVGVTRGHKDDEGYTLQLNLVPVKPAKDDQIILRAPNDIEALEM